MEFIAQWFDQATQFIDFIWTWLTSGIYELGRDFLIVLTKAAMDFYLSALLLMADVANAAISKLLADTGLMNAVRSAYSSLPASAQSVLGFFRVPESLSVIFSAFATRWAISFVPFVGR